jgi:hypothetical protein
MIRVLQLKLVPETPWHLAALVEALSLKEQWCLGHAQLTSMKALERQIACQGSVDPNLQANMLA